MPTYVYRREDDTTFEVDQKITEPPLEECPTTGQAVERVIVPTAFKLKGSGWAKDNYS